MGYWPVAPKNVQPSVLGRRHKRSTPSSELVLPCPGSGITGTFLKQLTGRGYSRHLRQHRRLSEHGRSLLLCRLAQPSLTDVTHCVKSAMTAVYSGSIFISQRHAFARSMCCRARKTVRSPTLRSSDTVHNRKATLIGSKRSADQKVSSPTRCCFACQALHSGTA